VKPRELINAFACIGQYTNEKAVELLFLQVHLKLRKSCIITLGSIVYLNMVNEMFATCSNVYLLIAYFFNIVQ
jgi:hypothetical protein